MVDTTLNEEDPSLLVIILDTNPFSWSKSEESATPLSFNTAQSHLLIFIHAYLSLKPDNRIAVVASHLGTSRFIYPTEKTDLVAQSEETSTSAKDANVYQRFKSIDKQISKNLKTLIESDLNLDSFPDKGSSAISGAFSMALCYINRMMKRDDLGRIKPRLLVLSVSADSPYQYIPIMNCIFSAQKASIPIDVCKIYGADSAFLQQAAYISSGTYLKAENASGLLQYLLFTFLPDRYVRNYFCLPGKDQVDFRAACFCHKKVIDVGYVCSVCLSIFCGFSPVCSTCRTKFESRNGISDEPQMVKTVFQNGLAPTTNGTSLPSNS
ncbi:RNA polymerase II transcription factor B subunit 4 [Basidiobolus ranarum]|uniref:General transcription and DNA repair factor IIH subunit TFB4 n=1 Tax=Basidiobolus ranarum TaxID=34480 RepID=A0ABR2WXX5_9FUNG